jgi:hypothetical protein
MSNIEHWIGVCMAAGYDDQDFIELVDAVAGRPEIERVEIRSSEPDAPQGAVSTAATIAAELRTLGQEWREEWPDGRVCKSALNEIADRLNALGGQ